MLKPSAHFKSMIAIFSMLTIGWATLIFYLLTTPAPPGQGLAPSWLPQWVVPAAGHYVMFVILAALLTTLAYPLKLRGGYLWGALAVVVLVSAIYGASLEWYQSTLPSRNSTWIDAAVNLVGALTGAICGVAGVIGLERKANRM
jgi:hypothetical protein